jgi:protein-S-isoprenylcysteine O-methyltransferase Ste14
MLLHHIILATLWIVYVVLHSVLASIGVKKKMQNILGRNYRHYRFAYTLFAFVSLVGVVWYQITIPTLHFYKPSFLLVAVGYLITITGFGIMLTCIKKYFMGLSGLRSLLQETAHQELIISGIHRFVRHPLYLGTFIFIWGLAILFPYLSLIIANAIITGYTLIAIKFEEKKLVQEFGSQYTTYQKTVPKLIPKW